MLPADTGPGRINPGPFAVIPEPVFTFGLLAHKPIVLGLDAVDIRLLALTLVLSNMTFSSIRTNVLLGAVHLLVFFAYLLLIFQR